MQVYLFEMTSWAVAAIQRSPTVIGAHRSAAQTFRNLVMHLVT
jgi:hypothetical protein